MKFEPWKKRYGIYGENISRSSGRSPRRKGKGKDIIYNNIKPKIKVSSK